MTSDDTSRKKGRTPPLGGLKSLAGDTEAGRKGPFKKLNSKGKKASTRSTGIISLLASAVKTRRKQGGDH